MPREQAERQCACTSNRARLSPHAQAPEAHKRAAGWQQAGPLAPVLYAGSALQLVPKLPHLLLDCCLQLPLVGVEGPGRHLQDGGPAQQF